MNDLGRKSVRAAYWSTLFTAGRFGLQLVAQVVLARLLGPESYGVFAMAMVVYTFSYFLATFGFAWGLAQLKTMTDEDIRFALTWQIVTGLLAGVALYLAAPLIAQYFREPRVLPVVQWMSLACVLNAAASVSAGVQRRQLAFRAMGAVQMASYAVGYLLVGIPLALQGFGVMSLVAAWLVQAASALVLGWLVCRHPLRPLWVSPQARALFSTGGAVLLTNLGNWALNNADRLIIGRFLAAEATGLYSVGYNLANLPFTLLVGALQPVFHAAGARLQDEPERLRAAYRSTMAAVLVLLIPMFAVCAWVAGDVVLAIYGPRWVAAGPVFAVLLLSVPPMVAWGMSTPVLWNTGRSYREFWLQLPLLALGLVALLFAVDHGVLAAAAVATGLALLRGAVLCAAACAALGLRMRGFVADLGRGLAFAVLLVGAAQLGLALLPAQSHPALRLAVALGVSAALGLGMLWWWPGCTGPNAGKLLARLAPGPWRRRHG